VDTVLLFVMYVLMSVVIQPSWLPNPIKLIIIIINPQSHSGHYFCHLHEYTAHKVQESRGITLRNYKKHQLYLPI